MITIITDKINTFHRTSYKKFFNNIELSSLSCTCSHSGSLIRHGYYERSLKFQEGISPILILRVKCKRCGKTHAVFPHFIVPYSRLLLSDHIAIIHAYMSLLPFQPIMLANEHIDESNIQYVIQQFKKHWKERIASFRFSITDGISSLSKQCLDTFHRQFMQIKSTHNIAVS